MTTAHPTTELVAFFGDGKHKFQLSFPLIAELERLTGYGIGAISKRLFAQDYRAGEVSELIRLGLIGGGTTPERAMQLTETYVHPAPLAASIPLALEILQATFFGVDKPQEDAP
ncbi:gene transfer agent family protein [Aestuariivirga sp.]|uniref:gene transfer agent family protein n=1 Tax=Aestuariivirga sp. TaxID=2650926 RepID=UPI003BAABF4D